MCTHKTPTQPNHIPVPISKAKRFNQRSATQSGSSKPAETKTREMARTAKLERARWPRGFPAGVEQVWMPTLVGYDGAIKK